MPEPAKPKLTPYDAAKRMVHQYVEKGPYELYPDGVRVESIIKGLAAHKEQYGHFYCPCMPIEESLQKRHHNMCPCTVHHEDIKRDGYCECALFVSPEFLERHKQGKV